MNVKKRSIVPNTSSRARSFLNFPLGDKRLLVFVLLFMLLSVSLVSACRCEVEGVLHGLRKALYDYYTNPSESSFMPEDLKDLLVFYVGIGSDQITVDCTEHSNKIDRASALADNIPGCYDGTKYGKCSDNKPVYCYAGRLVPRCRLCGCAEGQWCDVTYVYEEKGNKGRWGKCNPGYDVICSVDSDCGISEYIWGYYCDGGDVYRYYNKYNCLNPGEMNSSCVNETMNVLMDDCGVGEECVWGESECQRVTPEGKPSSIVIKGRMIDAITGEPWANLKLMRAEQPAEPARTVVETDSNGYFTINVDNFSESYSFVSWPSCGYQFGISVRWDSTKNGLVAWTQYLDSEPCEFEVFSSTAEIDVGDFKIWPAASPKVKADVPFKINFHTLPNVCPTHDLTYGNKLYKTEHFLSNILPINHRTEVTLTFEDGSEAKITSDIIPIEQKCKTVQLNYYNGQFSWGNVTTNVTNVTCTDSDGGINYDIAGTATGIYSGGIPSMHFIWGTIDHQPGVQQFDGPGISIYYDYCVNDVQANEGFCSPDGRMSSTSTNCPHGCENGVCIQNQTICTDSDGGIDYYTRGIIRGSKLSWDPGSTGEKEFDDSCVDFSIGQYGQVVSNCEPHEACKVDEYFCQDNTIYYDYVLCPNGCIGGACCPESGCQVDATNTTCTDTDGGIDYYTKGFITGSKLSWDPSNTEEKEFTDVCVDFSIGQVVSSCTPHEDCKVNEHFCSDGTIYYDYVLCPNGCSDGACINQTTTEGLVGHWRFDGNGNNEVEGGPAANIVGGSSFYSSGGVSGGYAYIPSSSDSVRIPYDSAFDLPDSFTIDFWFRQRSNQSFNQNLVYKGNPRNNYNFYIFRYLWDQYNEGAVITGFTSSSTGYWRQTSNPNEPPHNMWHHVVFTKDTSGSAYYIDGYLIHSSSYTDSARTPASDIVIADSAVDTDIDELRIYNYALSADEI